MNTDNTLNCPTHKQTQQTGVCRRCYPWVVIAFCSAFLFYKYILQVSPSVMTNDLMRVFGLNGEGLGNLSATYFYTYLVAQLFVGPLLDKYSARLLTALAIAVSALGAFMFSQAHSLETAFFARGLIGVGAAFATVSYMKMTVVWFKLQQFAFVGGLLVTAAMVGSMAGQAPMAVLVDHTSWRDGLMYAGLLGLVLSGLFYLFVKGKAAKHDNHVNDVSDKQTLKWKDFLSVLKHKHNWLLMFYSGLAFSPLAVFGDLWGVPFLEESHHLAKANAASLTSVMFLGLAVGGPLLGWVSDKLSKRYEVMCFGVLLSLFSLSSAVYLPDLSTDALGLLLFLFGFGTGAFMLGFAVGRELNSVLLAATVVGLINTGDAVFGAFSEPLVGKLLDVFWNGKVVKGVDYFNLHDFHLALAVLPLYLLAALFFLFGLRGCFKKNQL